MVLPASPAGSAGTIRHPQTPMTDQTKETAPKYRTITLTGRPPVRISQDDWPVIARSDWRAWDNQYECQADRTWTAHVRVRQHTDGRTIVYATYDYTTAWQGEDGASSHAGMLLPTGADIPAAIAQVVRDLAHLPEERVRDLIAECVADLPAENLA
jgi:hypothetical protein